MMQIVEWRRVVLPRKVKLALLALAAVFILFKSTINYVESGEAGITWNPLSGQVNLQSHAGWNTTAPWVFVTTIDTRPRRLCLTSAAHAAVNCRLVSFDIRFYKQFIAVEGWRWYWWSNRFSFNSGYERTYRGFDDVLRGYAFAAQQYPFVKIQTEY